MLFLLPMFLLLCICAPATVLYVSVAMFLSMLTRVLLTISTPGWARDDGRLTCHPEGAFIPPV